MFCPKEKTSRISMPLGGIGAGSIGLSGNGSLTDWEIFNSSDKGRLNGYTHFAVRVEKNGAPGEIVDFRILSGDYSGNPAGEYTKGKNYSGFGWGPFCETMAGWPHFREHCFYGEYPFGRVEFSGEKSFPGKASITGWSPLIPGDSRSASLPVCAIEIEICNNSNEILDYTVIGVAGNPWQNKTRFNRLTGREIYFSSGVSEDDLNYGDMTFKLLDEYCDFSAQEYLYRGGWHDMMEMYYHDVRRGGKFTNRSYPSNSISEEQAGRKLDHGLLAAHITLSPGASRICRFIISWNIPNRRNDWRPDADEMAELYGVGKQWKNYYAVLWKNSTASAAEFAGRYDILRKNSREFADALYQSSLPAEAIDGISANISILKSPTCLRLEDGTFYGWEGVGMDYGSCEGSCTHVWNYAQALPFLFPDLEKSMRRSHLENSIDRFGGSHFRVMLPLGIKADEKFFRPCVDGQFGDVMKIFRDWKITGDGGYVKHYWPDIRRTIEYAWSENNPDRWDIEQQGVITGRAHHTLDMELFGVSSWLTGHYTGALLAGAAMADFAGDSKFAVLCRELAEKGRKYIRENLFNGEFLAQKIDLTDIELLRRDCGGEAVEKYWNGETGEIKYQYGFYGCEIDAVLGEYYAVTYGIGRIFDREQLRSTLQSIFRYNFKKNMRDVVNTWRVFSYNDESGVMMCTWPDAENMPAIPLPYNCETMHGFEWTFAAHLLREGFKAEAEEVIRSIVSRYDGSNRNPYNEIECGSNYARSMASYGILCAYAGFSFDAGEGRLGFAPVGEDVSIPWTLGEVWGIFEQKNTKAKLQVRGGTFNLKELTLDFSPAEVNFNGNMVSAECSDNRVFFPGGIVLESGSRLEIF